MVANFKDNSNAGTPPCTRMFLNAWNSYAKELEKSQDPLIFKCDKCGENPKVLLGDGTSLGFHKRFLPPALPVPVPAETLNGR